jgi:phosphatidylserine/phosphatidylglycerophosphate/cardiolipin synthase-like enzyme
VVIGSVNWGKDALERRNETCVVVREAALAGTFIEYFNRPEVSATPFPAKPVVQ